MANWVAVSQEHPFIHPLKAQHAVGMCGGIGIAKCFALRLKTLYNISAIENAIIIIIVKCFAQKFIIYFCTSCAFIQ